MKTKSLVLALLAFAGASAVPVRALADVSLEYACVNEQPKSSFGEGRTMRHTRVVTYDGDKLSFGVVVDGVTVNEYVFDFASETYSETIASQEMTRTYSFDQLKKEFSALKIGGPMTATRYELFFEKKADPERLGQSNYRDYDFSLKKSFFGDRLAGVACDTLTYDHLVWNAAGRQRHVAGRAWSSTSVPGAGEWAEAMRKLRGVADFYLAKDNLVADFVRKSLRTDGVLVKADERAFVSLFERSLQGEVLVSASSDGRAIRIPESQLHRTHWSDLASKALFPVIPILFVLGIVHLVRHSGSRRPPFYFNGFSFGTAYLVVCAVFAAEAVHYFSPVPFYESFFVEAAAIALAVLGASGAYRVWQWQDDRRLVAAGKARMCSACRSVCDVDMSACPVCEKDF